MSDAQEGFDGRGRSKSRETTTQARRTQMKHAARVSRLEELELVHALGPRALSELERAEYDRLRLQRGPLSRRMARAKAHGIGTTVAKLRERRQGKAPAPAPVRLGHRIPRQVRVLLLRQEQRPLTGRQWKKLRKAARRQERAA